MQNKRNAMKNNLTQISAGLALAVCWGFFSTAQAQWSGREDILREVEKSFGDPPGMVRLDPHDRVWVDKGKKRVVVDGYIALNDGALEMMACLVGTKEHESIVATFCKAKTVHAALLAVGAEPGKPVQWEPFSPPTGSEIQIFALWNDEKGEKKHVDVRQWLRVIGTKDEILKPNWVFAGSILWQDPDSGEKIYQAEGGDLICVSNFSTATLDIPLESSQVNSGLMFAAFTDRIPPLRTPVRLVLQVVAKESAKDSTAAPQTTSPDSVKKNADSTTTQTVPPAEKNAPTEANQSTGENSTTAVPKT